MVILALTFLTPYFSFIPKATLAAVIVCAVLFMVEVAITKMIWNVHSKYLGLVDFTKTGFVTCRIGFGTICNYFRLLPGSWN